ncbi:DNA-directed RNA polymerase subunit beta [Aquibacillus sp. 3ASR75-11]|uniref:DNA-directed RNA polymerase subunit beta n=1 Tax=Terrihalobacillus insolitus TaxID=2950438 RepID=A0A9X3WX57_9BACI|nr:DNA-directed RNA polymerase subunit beta [Terrihalobacillus insolitus]MDC3425009.1 DNA-directed RNA polymerase subunit beta [Terrihalobacillus insolitus]
MATQSEQTVGTEKKQSAKRSEQKKRQKQERSEQKKRQQAEKNPEKAKRKEQRIKQKEEKKQNKKPKRRIFPIWLRIIVVLLLCGLALIAGLMLGFGVIGDGNPTDILDRSIWEHILNLINKGV